MDNITRRGKRFSELLGDQIRGEASKQRISAKTLAGLVGIHEVTMSKYLNAKVIPPASFISDCADVLGLSVATLAEPAYEAMLAELGGLSQDSYTLAASDADIDAEVEAQQDEA